MATVRKYSFDENEWELTRCLRTLSCREKDSGKIIAVGRREGKKQQSRKSRGQFPLGEKTVNSCNIVKGL